MKTLWIPACCVSLLAGMISLAIGHWTQLVSLPAMVIELPRMTTAASLPPEPGPAQSLSPKLEASPSATSGPEIQALREQIQRLETQQNHLLLQLAETNRDLLTLQFRVDTHSESFRPLPVADNPAVPAAIPVDEPQTTQDPAMVAEPALLPLPKTQPPAIQPQ